jgi:hypothetical protein
VTVADPNADAPIPELDPATAQPSDAGVPELPAQPVEPNHDTPGSFPTFYDKAAQARAAGYTWDEIGTHLTQGRATAKAAGYTDAEVNAHLGMDPSWDQPNTPLDYIKPQIPAGNGADQAAQTVRDFAANYLTPSMENPGALPPAPIRTPGDFLKAAGHDIIDVGKIFGGGVVQGLASTLEMMDGRPRSTEEWSQLNAEAMNFTGLLAGKGPGLKAADPRLSPIGLPATKDVIDAAASIVHPPEPLPEAARTAAPAEPNPAATPRQNAEALLGTPLRFTPPDLGTVMRNLGQNFVDTGEHPLDAAMRAQEDPSFAAQLSASRPDVTYGEVPAAEPAVAGGVGDAPPGEPPRGGIGDNGGPPLPPDITPETIQFRNPATSTGLVDNFQRIFNPADRTAEASDTAGIVREAMARQAQSSQISDANLRQFGRAVADLTPEKQAQFIHAYESGDLSYLADGSPLHDLAAAIKTELDARWQKMDAHDAAPGYIDNYMPHLYADADLAQQRLPAYRGTKSATGAKPFTKERIFSSFLDAAEVLDLKPLTTNPIELVMTHLFQADKYIASLDVVDQLKNAGLIKLMPADLTRAAQAEFAGTMRVDPSIARGGAGSWVAAEPVATILNRWLSPGLTGTPIFDLLRSGGNMLNMAQLGMSAFHGGFVTAEAGVSMVAKGIKQISRLDPEEMARGLGNIVAAPVSGPLLNGLLGRKVIQQVLGRADYGPEIQTIADALIAGGGRVAADPMYKASALGSFWENMKGSIISTSQRFGEDDGKGPMTLGQAVVDMYRNAEPVTVRGTPILPGAVRATAMLLPRVMDTIAAPLMEGYVPMMKAGGFANLMRDELRANPNMSPGEVRDTAGRIWKSIDNRLGQMVYDNRFWDKNLRDMGHVGVRSLGWTAGTIDEIGGGLMDFTQGRKVTAGEVHQLTDRASYTLALPIATAMMGAIFGTVYGTWNDNWGIKDYLFPPTGGKDAQGGPERASMPGYLKDAWEWGTSPGHTALAKINPLWTTLYQMMNNEQWNGAAITDPRKPFMDEAGDYADYIVKQFTPIVWQPRKESDAQSALGPLARQVGLRPAPYALREPEREAAYGVKALIGKLRKKQRTDAQ